MEKYKIVRGYRDHDRRDTIASGLTLKEAQAHCGDKETSSSTCELPRNKRRTWKFGPWFDGYEVDNS